VWFKADHSIVAFDLETDHKMILGKAIRNSVAPLDQHGSICPFIRKLKILKLAKGTETVDVSMDQWEESTSVGLLYEERGTCNPG